MTRHEANPGSGLWRLAALAALLAQSVMLYLPTAAGPESDLPLDKVAHFLAFAVVAALAVRAGIPVRWVTVLLVVQAGASELVQHLLLPDRGGDLLDLAADLLGMTAGLLLGLAWSARTRARARQRP